MERAADEEVLLLQAQFLAEIEAVVGVEDLGEVFRPDFAADGGDVVAGVEVFEVELLRRLAAPQAQGVDGAAHGILRGTPESIDTARMFGEFYPNPGDAAVSSVSLPLAIGAEAIGTFLLVLMIFALTEKSNEGRPSSSSAPLFIGLTVSSCICLVAPLTQAGLNPARDFGPRMVAWAFGWGKAAFPDAVGGFFWVYIIGPVVGAILSSLLFTRVMDPMLKEK